MWLGSAVRRTPRASPGSGVSGPMAGPPAAESGALLLQSGERRRTSAPGCIVDASLSVLNVVLVEKVGGRYSWSP